MALKKYEEADIAAIATAIREKTGGDKTYKVSQMDEGVNEVYEAGKKAEYDAFWDSFQKNGNRTEYYYAFEGWDEKSFVPKYDIRPKNAPYAFQGITGIVDLEQWLNDLGVVLDLSQCVATTDMFVRAKFEVLGILDFSNANNLNYLFTHCSNLKTIKKLVMPTKRINFLGTFNGCYALENIIIEGEIQGDIDFQYSTKLTKASIESIMSHLSPTATFTVTLSQTAVNNAFTTDEWQEIIDAKPTNVIVSPTNVTVSLI